MDDLLTISRQVCMYTNKKILIKHLQIAHVFFFYALKNMSLYILGGSVTGGGGVRNASDAWTNLVGNNNLLFYKNAIEPNYFLHCLNRFKPLTAIAPIDNANNSAENSNATLRIPIKFKIFISAVIVSAFYIDRVLS